MSGGNDFASYRVVKMSICAINAAFRTSEIAYVGVARIFAAGISRHEDRLRLLRRTTSATKCRLRSQVHSPVAGEL